MSTLKVGEIKHESFTGTTQLKLDSAGRLMVGTDTEGLSSANDLTIGGSGSRGITIRSGTSNDGNLWFSDGTSGNAEYRGYVQYEHANDRFNFGTAASTRMTIDSSGRLGVATTSPHSYAIATFNDSNGISLTGSTQTRIVMQHTNGGTNLKNFDIQTSDGNLRFRTIGDNNTTVTERLRIQSGGGVSFNGDTAAANALNDYEEGTFSPSFANVDNSVITVNHYNYTKIGRLVHINAKFSIGSNNDGSRFGFQLPFTQAGSRRNVISAISDRSGSSTAPFAFIIDPSQSYAYGFELDGFGDSHTAYATFSGNIIFITGTYESN